MIMEHLKVSIVVITLNEEKNIGVLLDSLLKQNYSPSAFEVIVVDGGSKDDTQKIVHAYHEKGKIKLAVDNGGSITSSRNKGIQHARYSYIAFTDADCIAPQNWLSGLVDGYLKHASSLQNSKLAGVGGANIPPEQTTPFVEAIGIAFDSFLGSLGSLQAKPFAVDKKVYSISCANSFYAKKALEDVGLFSEDLGNQGEDWEMGYKLRQKGYILMGLGGHFVWHNLRSTPRSFWKNMVFYGDGRMRLTAKHPSGFRLIYGLPFLFAAAMVSVALFPLHSLFFVPLLYFPLMFLYSFWLCLLKGKLRLTFTVFVAFLILHFGYTYGELKGLRWMMK